MSVPFVVLLVLQVGLFIKPSNIKSPRQRASPRYLGDQDIRSAQEIACPSPYEHPEIPLKVSLARPQGPQGLSYSTPLHPYSLRNTHARARARTLSVLYTHTHTQHVQNDIALYYIPTFGEPEASGLMRNSARMHIDLCFHTNYESTSW